MEKIKTLENLSEGEIKYSSDEDFLSFEKQSDFFIDLRENHNYWGGNNLRDMLDFCNRNQLRNIEKELKKLKPPF